MDAREQVIADALRLCAIPAPTGREDARARVLQTDMEGLGWNTRIDDAGNVLAWQGELPRHPLAVCAHLDTVFDLQEIVPSRDGDVLRGPGIGDNSLGLAGLLHLARVVPAPGLLLAATVGEENVGNLKGARHLVAEQAPRELIALEGGGIEKLVHAGPGSLRFQVTLQGPGGHSWSDRQVPSAVEGLLDLLAVFRAGHGCESCNVGRLEGGDIISARARQAFCQIEARDHDPENLQCAQELLGALAGVAADSFQVQVQELGARPGGSTDLHHPLVQATLQAILDAGLPVPTPGSFSTDANAAYPAGIPAVCVGLADSMGSMHTLDEQVDVRLLDRSLQALELLVARRLES